MLNSDQREYLFFLKALLRYDYLNYTDLITFVLIEQKAFTYQPDSVGIVAVGICHSTYSVELSSSP